MASSEGREDNCAGISVDATGSGGGQNGTELWYSSSDQALDSSSPSTSPSYWDSDDDDPGPRPSDLYGKFTWKIEKFSEISNRELRSNVFEVGGYKWYILVYPQGCDVCNHLSLFLCVSDYDKLLPGWSHFAQFTIAVVNKDPKKSKYSDTLHRFCKKEHDWGWKKFMELSKVLDGFIVADILVIKAQVQVIRENPNRPFRCLDSQYRRELVRVYLTNVEGICRRFVEEKREKLGTFIEDVSKWSSFCAFWLAIDESVRHHLSREKTDVILKAIVKQFFNEKEVTSTVVMDALYSGYKTLNDQNKSKKEKADGSKGDNNFPVVSVENDYFVLVDDVLSLLEKAAAEPLPPFKEDKGPQNRTKDCSGDDFAKDSVERDERRLTDLGKRTIEIYVLSHLFSNRVEVAYREAIALKRQEELIREEEAAGQAEMEFRAKHQPAEKEKKSKKKQAKQRRNHRKDKKRMREEKPSLVQGKDLRLSVQKQNPERCSDESATPNFVSSTMGDEDADLSGIDMLDNVVGTLGPAIENGDAYRVDWDRDGSEPHQSMEASFSGDASSQAAKSDHTGRRHQSTLDDSSSTCSTDSLASAAVDGSCKEKMSVPYQNQSNRKLKSSCEEAKKVTLSKTQNFSRVGTDSNPTQDGSSSTTDLCSKTVILSLKEHIHWLEQRLAEKEEEVLMLQEKLSLQTHQAHDFLSKNQHSDSTADGAAKNGSDPPSLIQSDEYKQASSCAPADTLSVNSNKPSCHSESPATSIAAENGSNQRNGLYNSNTRRNKMPGLFASGKHDDLKSPTHHMDRMQPSIFSQKRTAASGDSPSFDSGNSSAPMPSESNEAPVASVLSRPSSAPLIPAVIRPTTVSLTVPNAPALSRSASASGRLGAVELTAANLSLPQSTSMTPSYKMAAVGKLRNSYTNQVSLTVAGVNTNSAEDTSQGPNVTHSTMILKNPLSAPTSAASNIPVSPIKNYRVAVNSEYSKGQRKGGSFSSSNSASPCLSAASVSSQSMTKVDHTTFRSPKHVERAVGFTFGSVTPEMLKHQRSNTCIPGLEEDAIKVDQNKQESVFAQHIQQQGQGSQNLKFYQPQDQGSSDLRMHQTLNDLSIDGTPSHVYYPLTDARQGGSLSSDEFPHIDIINDLLDDEHYRGRKMPYHSTAQNSNRDIAFPSFERLNSDDLPPDLNIINGDIGWSRLQEEGLFQLRAFSDPSSVALGDNSHRVSPYTHSPYAQPRSQLGNVFDGVPCHWPVNNADFSAGGINGNAYDNADGHISYHLHANAMSLSDSSSFSSGQTEYTMPSPRKDM